jgi:hypothetical protein
MLGGAALLRKNQPALALYGALSQLVYLGQGEFVDTFRFSAVVFPVLFILGDTFARAPRWILAPTLLTWVAFNLYIARRYAFAGWAY